MVDEETPESEGGGLNRGDFLNNAGVVVTGSALAVGMTLAAENIKGGA